LLKPKPKIVSQSHTQIPDDGFFSTRLGAQITDSSDVRPSYIISDGDFLYKDPDDGITT